MVGPGQANSTRQIGKKTCAASLLSCGRHVRRYERLTIEAATSLF